MKDYLQQGDVLIFRVNIPTDAKKIKKRPLAYGEHTGNSHQVFEDIEMYEKGGILYLKNDNPVDLKHEEHKAVTIPAGDWQVGIVKEYDPFLEESRNVRD